MEQNQIRKEGDEGLSRSLTDLKECNKERIHLISTIQGRGAVLFFSLPDQRIQSASENIQDFLEASHDDVIGAKLGHVIEAEWTKTVLSRASEFPWPNQRGRYFQYRSPLGAFDCYLYHTDGLFGLEIEKLKVGALEAHSAHVADSQTITEHVLNFHSEMKTCRDVGELANLACKTIRAVTQLDRVMLYKFLYPTWHGEVIGEDRVMQAHSYMGHRFPSSDIPQPARELYLRNKVRIIGDVEGTVSRISPPNNPVNDRPIDLSDSRLRGSSLVHIEYLKNMGVRASLSFAITVRGELLGLVACHHFGTFHITQDQRNACELVAEAYAAHAPLLETLNTYRSKFAFQSRLANALEPLRESQDGEESVFKGHAIADIFTASGMALVQRGNMEFSGLTPRPAGISELAARLRDELRREIRPVLAINNLHERLPNLSNTDKLVAGVLAVELKDDAILMIFRTEVIKTITWGGDPVKQLDKKNLRGEINPRKSFEAWKEVIHGYCTDWQPYEIEGAQQFAETLEQVRAAGGRN